MSIVQKLTEGIVNRDLAAEGAALVSKWESTGLLEGLGDDHVRNGMARLLENQAKELLRESSSMAAGDVEGFAAVAFPLVRRVFGNLIANELVSVQPMSLPSGLIFFLDFVFSGDIGGRKGSQARLGYVANTSLYGGGVVGQALTGGVNLSSGSNPEAGPYALNNGYSSPTGSLGVSISIIASGTVGTGLASSWSGSRAADGDRLVQYDPTLSGSQVAVGTLAKSVFTASSELWNSDDYVAITLANHGIDPVAYPLGSGCIQARRLTRPDYANEDNILFVIRGADGSGQNGCERARGALVDGGLTTGQGGTSLTASFPMKDDFQNVVGDHALGAIVGNSAPGWGLEGNADIPEIDIKIDSVSVTAITKKLKAKWTPELGQDLNAYHNLDAEVELTQILSEQVALEIDREIIEDLVRGAKAATYHWSRSPGRFVNVTTGIDQASGTAPPDFTGNVSEWYETLVETINDVSAQIHRKTLRGAANFVVTSPEVANILEFTAGFRANVTADSDRGEIGAVKVGSLSKKFDILVDPYFPRNLILVGRRGSSFLESGYVYAPYVPLQTTPTIFGVEDFVPRKGVMTRYAKKMVRPDMYGLVIVRNLV